MKASELQEIVENYRDYYVYSDLNSAVVFGCDCGCGGDYYTPESWDEMVRLTDEAEQSFKNFCEKFNIEWDL